MTNLVLSFIRLKNCLKLRRQSRAQPALALLILIIAPHILLTLPAAAETDPAQAGNPGQLTTGNTPNNTAPPAQKTSATDHTIYSDANLETSLIQEAAEQNNEQVQYQVDDLLRRQMNTYNDPVYLGLHQWWSDDIISNLFANIGQLTGKWLSEFINGWVADTVTFLTAFLRIFVLNPNIAVNGLSGGGDDISPAIRQIADIMYGIAIDLLLLLFILSIWKYWADAAWRGGGNLMGSVGRLIFTAGLMLAWPTIYTFEVQITNEMIHAIFWNTPAEVLQLDQAMGTAVKAGLLATTATLAHAFAPVIGAVAGGAIGGGGAGLVLGTVGDAISFAGLLIYLILGAVLIGELIYMLVLKAIQTALLTAQYMFAPVFLVFFATPDTENVTSGYVKSFVEVSLWTFVWVGMLRILVVVINSDFNPWGKIIMAVGILQLMIQVPSFLARAQISPMSDFVSAGLLTGGLLSGAKTLAYMAKSRTGQAVDYLFNQQYAARGMKQSQTTEMNVPTEVANKELLTGMRAAAVGKPVPGAAGSASAGANGAPQPNLPELNTTLRPPESDEQRKRREALEKAQSESERQRQANQGQTADLKGASPGSSAPPPAQSQGGGLVSAGATSPGAAAGGAASSTDGPPAPTRQANPLQYALNEAVGMAGVSPRRPARAGQTGDGQSGDGIDLPEHLTAQERPSGVFNPAEGYNQSIYKFVQMKTSAVNARIFNGNSIGYSDDGTNKLVGDGKGNLRHMRARKGASPEEVAHLVMAGGFTELFRDDPEAFDAARESAIAADEDGPRGLAERMGAGFLAYSGKSFKQTATAKQRFARSLFTHAALGSEAYISGKDGNSYTQYLQRRFGDWSSFDDTWGTHIMTDKNSPESPWNPAYMPGTESLFAAGLPISNPYRAASTNPYVMAKPGWQRKTVIPAIAKYATEQAIAEGYGQGSGLERQMILDAAIGRIAPTLSNGTVESAYAVEVESSGTDVSMANVNTVANLVQSGSVDNARSGYHALRLSMGYRNGFRQATNRVNVQTQAGSSSAPVDPSQIPQGLLTAGQSADDQTLEIVVDGQTAPGGPSTQPDQSLVINTPGGNAGQPQVQIGSTGSTRGSSSSQRINVQANTGQSGSDFTLKDIQQHVESLGSSYRGELQQAQIFVESMHAAGFNDSQMQDHRIVQVAHDYAPDANVSRLSDVQVASRVLGPSNDLSAGNVEIIHKMIDSGWNPSQINRPDFYTAMDMRDLIPAYYPSPTNIRALRSDPDYQPGGHRIPPRTNPPWVRT